jgi:hypothetical protein
MIQLRIKNESDLYNPYDPSQTRINEGVYHYLNSFCAKMASQEHQQDILQIITDSPIDQDRFQKALQDAVKSDRDEFDRQIAKNNRRFFWELIVGIGLSVLGVALSVILDQVLLAIISFFGSMAIRDAVTIQTTINHDIKDLKKRLEPFSGLSLKVLVNNRTETP